LPYVAPEVLRSEGKEYSKASDVYSFGAIAWEIFSGKSPYHDLAHEEFLAVKICKGLRPNMNEIVIPQLLKNLISKCWDANPEKRPTASELVKIFREWQEEIKNKNNFVVSTIRQIEQMKQQKKNEDTEFYRQYL
jgi:serine/threonine protein kinase